MRRLIEKADLGRNMSQGLHASPACFLLNGIQTSLEPMDKTALTQDGSTETQDVGLPALFLPSFAPVLPIPLSPYLPFSLLPTGGSVS